MRTKEEIQKDFRQAYLSIPWSTIERIKLGQRPVGSQEETIEKLWYEMQAQGLDVIRIHTDSDRLEACVVETGHEYAPPEDEKERERIAHKYGVDWTSKESHYADA